MSATREIEIALVVETPAGPMMRLIPPAMPPRLGGEAGKAVEDAAHSAATVWGLPDFAFRPRTRSVGSGSRELGDGMLVVGELGVVVQVKARAAASADPAREARWLRKNTAKALRQARGTIRQLRRTPALLTNGRGREVEVDGNGVSWIRAIVIDHPDPPEGLRTAASADLEDAVVLLRRDWDFLFDQLKSTHAVARYLRRVAGEAIELGTEPIRYYKLAGADAEAKPAPLDPKHIVGEIEQISEPLLPLAPAATDDRDAHHVFRTVLEDIAGTKLQTTTEDRRVRVLAELDRLPVQHRALIGRYVLDRFNEVATANAPGLTWHLRRVSGGLGDTQLGFGVCSQPWQEDLQNAFSAWTQLRHHEFTERLGPGMDEPVTVSVLLTPCRDTQRPWDTTMCSIGGVLDLSTEEIEVYREVWRAETEATAEVA